MYVGMYVGNMCRVPVAGYRNVLYICTYSSLAKSHGLINSYLYHRVVSSPVATSCAATLSPNFTLD